MPRNLRISIVQPDATLAALIGTTEPLKRTQVTVKIWDYIRRAGLQGTATEGRQTIFARADTPFREFLGGADSCTMFELQKHISRHVASAGYTEI